MRRRSTATAVAFTVERPTGESAVVEKESMEMGKGSHHTLGYMKHFDVGEIYGKRAVIY